MRTDRLVFRKNDFAYICISLLLFFQIYLQQSFGVFQYLDETVTVGCLFIIFLKLLKGRLEKEDISILTVVLSITVIGIISNIIAGVQTGWLPILTDIGNSFKVFIVYIGANSILDEKSDKQKIIGTLAFFIKIFVWIAFAFMILHELHVISMGNDVRYGLRSFMFINNGAGQLSMMFYYVIFVLTLNIGYTNRKIDLTTIAALIVWCSTLRSRAFMYCLVFVFLYWIIIRRKKKVGLSYKTVIPIIGVLYLLAADQFETYFANTATARANFLIYGIKTLQRYFPLGSGFATYGTDAAAKYYSKLYVEYGFQHVYGLAQGDAKFAHDTYWPAIMAQFGIIGTVLMVVLIWKLCKDVLSKTKTNSFMSVAGIFVVVTQTSSSIATATFFNFVTVSLFFIVPLAFQNEDEEKANENINLENYAK